MSVRDSFHLLKQSLASRWQVPLLACAVALLILSVLRIRPQHVPPTFEQMLDQVIALQRGEFYLEASEQAGKLLEEPNLTHTQKGAVYQALAETIYLVECTRKKHDLDNAQRIALNYHLSIDNGIPATAKTWEHIAQAHQWLGNSAEAIEAYRKAIDLGSPDRSRLRRAIIEQLRLGFRGAEKAVREELAQMLYESQLQSQDLTWAAEQQINSLVEANELDVARDVLNGLTPRLEKAGQHPHAQYLNARLDYLTHQYDQAERILLALRNELVSSDPLAAKAGWLLGRLHYQDGRPQEALACFREVLQSQPPEEYAMACRLGIAESLAALEHIEEAATAYEEVSGQAAGAPHNDVFDRDSIRVSLTSLYATLKARGQVEESLRFLRLAVGMIPLDNHDMAVNYCRKLAELYAAIGEQYRSRVTPTPATTAPTTSRDVSTETALRHAHDAFQNAAEEYLRLSRLLVLDDQAATDAAWEAANYFDRANEPDRLVAVLETFLQEHPGNPRLPEALRRLGLALQSQGRYKEAIARYIENQDRYARTPPAMRSLIPMAQCYMALDPKAYPDAERVLLTIVDQPAEKGYFAPQALEYREAVFLLGDLYDRWGKPAKAIGRLEEFLERYSQDPRVTKIQFTLANAHRKRALGAIARTPTSAPAGSDDTIAIDSLTRAEELFGEVIRSLEQLPRSRRSHVEETCLRHSYLYRADCVFDRHEYARALAMYEEIARSYRTEAMALAAYVQMLNCYQRMGKPDQGRQTLDRIRVLVKGIPAEQYKELPAAEDATWWKGFFDWVETSNVF